MYARLQTSRSHPTDPRHADRLADVLDVIGGHPGFAGAWSLTPVAATETGLLTLWATEEDAVRAPERTAAARGGGPRPITLDTDVVLRVAEDADGPAAAETPAVAQMIHFDGPRSPEWLDAHLRAGRERIQPATDAVPGVVRTLVLVGESNAQVTVVLATSTDVLETLQARVMATELLPWEDPAMLTGADRVELFRVTTARTGASRPAGV